MTQASDPAYFFLALAVVGLLVVAFLAVSVKVRGASSSGKFGVRVYDFGADLTLPPTLHSRSYQFALYLTMKSLPREPAEPSPRRVNAAAR